MIELGAMLAGSLVAGLIGEIVGLRLALVVGASAGLFGALWLTVSPVRHLRVLPPSKLAPHSPADAA